MRRRSVLLCIAFTVVATAAFAQLSDEYRNWAESAVQYLMAKPERTAWDTVRTNDDAHDFIEAFWARRDPTPGTPANEFRQTIEERTKEADKRFADRQRTGSLTDRGKVFVLFGEPDHIDVNADVRSAGGSALSQSMGRFDRRPEAELWIYRGANAARLGTKSGDLGLLFSDEITAGEIVLAPGSKRAMEAAAIAVAREAYSTASAAAARVASDQEVLALGLIVVADRDAAVDLVRQAQEGGDFAALARKHSLHASREAGGYMGKVARGQLAGDFKTALAGSATGAVVMIQRGPAEFAVVKILTPDETQRAERSFK